MESLIKHCAYFDTETFERSELCPVLERCEMYRKQKSPQCPKQTVMCLGRGKYSCNNYTEELPLEVRNWRVEIPSQNVDVCAKTEEEARKKVQKKIEQGNIMFQRRPPGVECDEKM